MISPLQETKSDAIHASVPCSSFMADRLLVWVSFMRAEDDAQIFLIVRFCRASPVRLGLLLPVLGPGLGNQRLAGLLTLRCPAGAYPRPLARKRRLNSSPAGPDELRLGGEIGSICPSLRSTTTRPAWIRQVVRTTWT